MNISEQIYISESLDPYFNLAVEDQLLRELKAQECALFVYRNSPCVVMGRFQNPWIEVNLAYMQEKGVKLVRRQSGGGCVYHDLGNMNFCFLYGDKDYKKNENNRFLIELLAELDVDAKINERSDLIIQKEKPYKFSGSAFKQKRDRSFHHCTCLLDSDLSDLNHILDSPLKELKSKSTPSNRSHVINLQSINKDLTFENIIANLSERASSVKNISSVKETDYLDFLKSWKWLYGETPLFELPLRVGEVTLKLEVRKAQIVSAEFSDVTGDLYKEVEALLVGKSLEDPSILEAELNQMEVGELTLRALRGVYLT